MESGKVFHDDTDQLICLKKYNNVTSDGIWFGDNPLDHVFPLLLLQGILAFVACQGVYFLLRPLKQPKFVCYVLGGILLGPSVLGQKHVIGKRLYPPIEKMVLHNISSITEVYFNFLIAVKVDISRILSIDSKARSIGVASFVLPFPILLFLIMLCMNYIGGLPHPIICFGVSTFLSVSYIPVVANALEELNLVTSELGLLASSCAFVSTLILWFSLPLFLLFSQNSLLQSIAATLSFSALAILIIYVVRPTMLWMVKKTPQGEPMSEVFVVLTLVGALVMGCLTNILGLGFSFGALLLGCTVPEGPPMASILIEKSELFVSDILMPLWYFLVGLQMDVHSIHNWKAFLIFHCILLVSYFAKLLGVLLASMSFKVRPRFAFLLGLILNCKGAIDVMVFFQWKYSKILIDDQSFVVLVTSMIAVSAVVTPLVEILHKPQTLESANDFKNKHRSMRAIENTPRNSKFSVICCIHNEENVHSIIALLEASNPTQLTPICAYIIHLLDILGRAAPLVIPYNKHNVRLKGLLTSTSFSSDHIMRAFMNYSKNSVGPVTIHPFTIIAPYRSMHRNIFQLAEDNQVPLIIVPYHENQRSTQGNRVATSIHILNASLQKYAPCTVGVMVDRRFPISMSSSHFSYDVAVIFIGGQDDRETLAYAAQMSRHPNVSITVIRIISFNKKDHDEENDSEYIRMERMMDEDIYVRFKTENMSNACVVCWEIVVDDILRSIVDPIRSSGRDYDLVMVGHGHLDVEFRNKEMPAFEVNDDLGVIGDIVYASSDLYGVWSSLLVLKHCGDHHE